MKVLLDLTGVRSLAAATRWLDDLCKGGHETWVTGTSPNHQQALQNAVSDQPVVFIGDAQNEPITTSRVQNDTKTHLDRHALRIDALILTDSECIPEQLKASTLPTFVCSERGVTARNLPGDPSEISKLQELESLLTEIDTVNRADDTNSPNDRLRLAMVSPWPPARSGISDYCADLVPALAPYYDVTVIDSTPKELLHENDPSDPKLGVRDMTWFLENGCAFDRVVYQVGNSGFHAGVLQAMSAIPGIVVLHDFFIGYCLWWEQEHQHLPIGHRAMLEQHGLKALHDSLKDSASALSHYPVNQEVFRQALGVIVHSQYARSLSAHWHGEAIKRKVRVVNLIKPAHQKTDRLSAREALGIRADEFVICSFGYISPQKLTNRIVQAWSTSKLCEQAHCRLIFVGENHKGEYGKHLVRAIEALPEMDRVQITGFVDQETFHQYLAAADIGIQLRSVSHGETSGAVMDAMRYGLPLIVNANGSFDELDSSAVIKLPDHFTDEALTNAIDILYSDSKQRADLSEGAKRCVRQAHSPERCASQYREAIEAGYRADAVMPLRARRLFLDVTATHYSRLKSGIERVALALCRELINLEPRLGVVTPVFLTHENGHWRHRQANTLVGEQLGIADYLLEDTPIDPQPGDTLLTLDLAPIPFQGAQQQDLFQNYRAQGIKIFSIVYDLLPVRMPEVFPPGSSERHTAWLDVISTFDGALCISAHVADDLRAWRDEVGYSKQHYDIGHFMLGADTGTFNAKGSQVNRRKPFNNRKLLKANRLTFLMVGTIEPRKAYLEVLDIFESLWKQDFDFRLIVVGREGWTSLTHDQRRDIPHTIWRLKNHPEKYNRLIWIGNADDRKLERAYDQADCLIAASYDEGFGLPIIEAAQRGIPVIARDIPVFREVAPSGTTFFSKNELANAIIWWRRPEENSVSSFSHTWSQSAVQVLDWVDAAMRPPSASDKSELLK